MAKTFNYASTAALTAMATKVKSLLSEKVDKRVGYDLSKNDLTDELKGKYDGAVTYATTHANVEDFAEKNIIETITVNGEAVVVDPQARIAAIKTATKVSDLQNDSNFQTDVNVTNTLKAYSTTEAMNEAIRVAVADAGHLTYKKVDGELPLSGEANVIYLKASASAGAQNIFDEYMWIDNAWEIIGSTYVNMADYYKKSETMSTGEINGAISTALANYTTTEAMNQKFALYYTKEEINGKVTTLEQSIADSVQESEMVEIDAEAVNKLFD